MQGLMNSVLTLFCAAYGLHTARELDLDSSSHRVPVLMKLSDDLLWASQHIGEVVPQPSHTPAKR